MRTATCRTAREGSLRALQERGRGDTELLEWRLHLKTVMKTEESKEQERQYLKGNVESLITNGISKFK